MGLFIHRDLTYKEDDVNNGIEQLKATDQQKYEEIVIRTNFFENKRC